MQCSPRIVETHLSNITPPHPLLMMLETRVIAETGHLLLTLPLLRLQAKRGMGEPVMVLPGFMADDRSTSLLRGFLKNIGYHTYPWQLGVNRRPMLEILPILREMVERITSQSDQKIRLIGWSRGGILSRELARDCPDLVAKVITIGTPVKGGIAVSAIGRWVQRETGLTPRQMTNITQQRSRSPISVPVRAIYSKTDGVVAWKACIDDDTEDVKHYEVFSSHIGMGSNVEVFRLIPKLLSEP